MKNPSTHLFLAGAVIVLLLQACGSLETGPKEPPQPEVEVPAVEPLPQADTTILPTGSAMRWFDHNILIYHQGREFQIGDDSETGASPTLDDFWIYRFNVTNDMYRACVQAGACNPPAGAQAFLDDFDPDLKDHPVVSMTWEQAGAYCGWMGLRLPTAAEWQVASRGSIDPGEIGSLHPWGEAEPTCQLTNLGDCWGTTTGVMDFPTGQSASSVFDMVGNVRNWTQDFFIADSFSTNLGDSFKVEKGESVTFKVEEGEAILIVVKGNEETRSKVEEGESVTFKVEKGEKILFKVEKGEAVAFKVEEGESLAINIGIGELVALKVEEGESVLFKVEEGEKRVVRGSSFNSPATQTGPDLDGLMFPGEYKDDLGFRCAIAAIQFQDIQAAVDLQDAHLSMPGFNPSCEVPANVGQVPARPACEELTIVETDNCNMANTGQGGVDFLVVLTGDEIVWWHVDPALCTYSQDAGWPHTIRGSCFGPMGGTAEIQVCRECTPEFESLDWHPWLPCDFTGMCPFPDDLPDEGPGCSQGYVWQDDACRVVVPPPNFCPDGMEMNEADQCCYFTAQFDPPNPCWLGFYYDESTDMCVSQADLYPPVVDCQVIDLQLAACSQSTGAEGGGEECNLTCKPPAKLDKSKCECKSK